MAVGRWLGVGVDRVAESTSWMIGMPTIIANVTRSRRSCRNSLLTIAHQRWTENQPAAPRFMRAPAADRLAAAGTGPVVRRAPQEVDERRPRLTGRRRLDGTVRGPPSPRATTGSSAGASLAGDVRRRRRRHGLIHAGIARSRCVSSDAGAARRTRGQSPASGRRRAVPGRAGVVGDVGELVAALGLVHVVRADRTEMPRPPADAARPRTRGRRGRRRPSARRAAAARGGAGQAASARRCFQPPESAGELPERRTGRGRTTLGRPRRGGRGHLVHARREVEVLADRQVVPEREALRHVADPAFDRRGVAPDVVAEAGAAAGVGREQAAHHADRRRLAAAVGAEEAEDPPRATRSETPATTSLLPKRLWMSRARR